MKTEAFRVHRMAADRTRNGGSGIGDRLLQQCFGAARFSAASITSGLFISKSSPAAGVHYSFPGYFNIVSLAVLLNKEQALEPGSTRIVWGGLVKSTMFKLGINRLSKGGFSKTNHFGSLDLK